MSQRAYKKDKTNYFMKKVFMILALAFVFASCGGSQTEDVATGVLVDSSLIDTVKQDTIVTEDTAVSVTVDQN